LRSVFVKLENSVTSDSLSEWQMPIRYNCIIYIILLAYIYGNLRFSPSKMFQWPMETKAKRLMLVSHLSLKNSSSRLIYV
jgi:hypothetical protein